MIAPCALLALGASLAAGQQATDDPEGAADWHSSGDRRLSSGDRAGALAAFERDLLGHPECYEARINAAAIRLDDGDAWGAAEHYGVSLRYHPGDARAAEGLARARRALALRHALRAAAPALVVGILVGVAVARRRRRS